MFFALCGVLRLSCWTQHLWWKVTSTTRLQSEYKRKKLIARPRCRLNNNIKMYRKGIGCEGKC